MSPTPSPNPTPSPSVLPYADVSMVSQPGHPGPRFCVQLAIPSTPRFGNSGPERPEFGAPAFVDPDLGRSPQNAPFRSGTKSWMRTGRTRPGGSGRDSFRTQHSLHTTANPNGRVHPNRGVPAGGLTPEKALRSSPGRRATTAQKSQHGSGRARVSRRKRTPRAELKRPPGEREEEREGTRSLQEPDGERRRRNETAFGPEVVWEGSHTSTTVHVHV